MLKAAMAEQEVSEDLAVTGGGADSRAAIEFTRESRPRRPS
jgi:hypothetical protein